MEETQLEKLSPPPDSALALRQGTAGKILTYCIILMVVYQHGSSRIPTLLKQIKQCIIHLS